MFWNCDLKNNFRVGVVVSHTELETGTNLDPHRHHLA